MAYGVIYKITNQLDGKGYVGQTTRTIEVRFKEHSMTDFYIGKAIQAYGEENFTIEILEECDTREQLNEREIFWIAKLNCKHPNGYNLTDGGEGNIITEELINRRSINSIRIWASRSPEERSNIAKRREAQKSPEVRSETARKAAMTRNRNVETHMRMSAAQRDISPFKNLLNAIIEQRFSYAELSKLMGLAISSISRKMRGKRSFTTNEQAKLVEIFGLPAEYLMQRDDEK